MNWQGKSLPENTRLRIEGVLASTEAKTITYLGGDAILVEYLGQRSPTRESISNLTRRREAYRQ